MNNQSILKPSQRSKLRAFAGKKFFIAKRIFEWYFLKSSFATKKVKSPLEFEVFHHSSILLRELKDVEMWLQYNKIENLKIAVGCIDNIVIAPGQVFSFWYMVGNPTKRRGFKLGMTLHGGKVKAGYGGGLCQLANLLYWMTIHTPLTVTERWRHSFDVFPDVNRTLPFGSGATVSYNYIDLQITNNTTQSFQLNLWLTQKELCGEVRSNKEVTTLYDISEANHIIKSEYWGGYTRHNQIVRKAYNKLSGDLVQEEVLTENHAIMMYNPLIEQGEKIDF